MKVLSAGHSGSFALLNLSVESRDRAETRRRRGSTKIPRYRTNTMPASVKSPRFTSLVQHKVKHTSWQGEQGQEEANMRENKQINPIQAAFLMPLLFIWPASSLPVKVG